MMNTLQYSLFGNQTIILPNLGISTFQEKLIRLFRGSGGGKKITGGGGNNGSGSGGGGDDWSNTDRSGGMDNGNNQNGRCKNCKAEFSKSDLQNGLCIRCRIDG